MFGYFLVLASLALAQDLAAILNSNVSMTCLIAINSQMATLKSGCLSPYDLGTIQNPPADIANALIVKSFSFMPTMCGIECTKGIKAMEENVVQVCANEVILKKSVMDGVLPKLGGLLASLNPPSANASTVAAQKQAMDEKAKQLAAFATTLNLRSLLNIFKIIRNIGCVKDTPDQTDLPNPKEHKYCISRQLQSFADLGLDGLSAIPGLFQAFKQRPQMMCDVCYQYQSAQYIQSVSLLPEIMNLMLNQMTQLSTGITQTCKGLEPPKLVQFSSNQSNNLQAIVGLMAVIISLVSL
ncbi:hypothetical protein BC833DRAFT_574028 [Globomyces pollinis-pini]|nr:hypothetical protein BC833DRAFT_574028 [Globomyces pollinis-pini]